MENEEKKGCCEGKEKCEHGMMNCCHNGKKCHMMKKVVLVIVIIIAFCLGSQWGEMKALIKGNHYSGRGQMMNWGYNQIRQDEQGAKLDAVDASKAPVAPVTAQ